jgi:uncharacterized protein (TIRG00374 family)
MLPASSKDFSHGFDWRKWEARSVCALGLLLAGYVGVTVWAVRGNLTNALHQLSWRVVPAVIGFVAVGWILRSLRWHYYVRCRRWEIPFGHSVWAFFASFAFAVTPGKVGEVIKSVLLRTRYNVPLADGAGVLLVERLGDLIAVLILAAGGLTLMTNGPVYFAMVVLLVGAMTVAVSSRKIHRPVLARFARVKKIAPLVEKIVRLLDSGRALLQPAPLAAGIAVALVAWTCEGIAFHLLVRSFGLAIHPLTSCAIFGIGTVVGALSALPGGVGGFEVVAILLLTKLGLPTAALPVVVFRFCSLWLANLVGFAFLLGWLTFISKPARAAK